MATSSGPHGRLSNGSHTTELLAETSKAEMRKENGRPSTLSLQGDDQIIDIRRGAIQNSIRDEMLDLLHPAEGSEKRMPTLLLYDEAGLKLFEEITYLEEYYLTNAEIEIFRKNASEIAENIRPGSMLVELGSGNLRKINILLQAIEQVGKQVDYYALDLSLSELQRTLGQVPRSYRHVSCHGLHGTYHDGLAWLQLADNLPRSKFILSLGSSIGNFTRSDAAGFLAGFARILGPHDRMLIGLDACKDPDKVYHAYNDREGVTHRFVMNGLDQANLILDREVFKPSMWKIIGEYDELEGRHQAFYSPTVDVEYDGIKFHAGERVKVEESYKFSKVESDTLWADAGLIEIKSWANQTSEYYVHLLSRAAISYPLDPLEYASTPVPSLDKDWRDLWSSWDAVTKGMISEAELLAKPIQLRNACIFYLGHIPCFMDMHLTHASHGVPTEPADYWGIFERGIDPDVDNPDHCHAHSEIPDTWPPVDQILAYEVRVRERVRQQYEKGLDKSDRRVGRALWLGFEHEIMHLETLLYMLLQSDKTLTPPGTMRPDFDTMAHQAKVEAVPNEWFTIPDGVVTLGLDDPETDDGPDRYFGWDNERPARQVDVRAFVAKARPITNEEYASYLEKTHSDKSPATWVQRMDRDLAVMQATQLNGSSSPSAGFLGGKAVRTVYGLVPLAQALSWPVMASYDELRGYATWMDSRIPTLEEVRRIYWYVDTIKAKETNQVLAKRIAAVNGHLSNDGVEESPPSRASLDSLVGAEHQPDPRQLFTNLEDCNVGFHHWHPTPVTQNGSRLSGQGDFGGAWEWTSTVLGKHDGFEPMNLYPAYTADFFDGKHNVALGGSWATHPRIAGKKTFVNWYQRNYPYAWTGARLVKDL